ALFLTIGQDPPAIRLAEEWRLSSATKSCFRAWPKPVIVSHSSPRPSAWPIFSSPISNKCKLSWPNDGSYEFATHRQARRPPIATPGQRSALRHAQSHHPEGARRTRAAMVFVRGNRFP